MNKQTQQPARRGTTSLLGFVLALGLILVGHAADAGEQARVSPINAGRGVSSVVEGRAKGDANVAPTGYAHVVGYADYSHSRGLNIDGLPINITRSTAVYPDLQGLSAGLRPRQFSGREMTVFGAVGSGGITAALVILRPTATDYDTTVSPEADDFESLGNDPRVGVARESDPR